MEEGVAEVVYGVDGAGGLFEESLEDVDGGEAGGEEDGLSVYFVADGQVDLGM